MHEVLRASGQPLDAGARAFFEPRFGHDFSHVRVHADPVAEAGARSIGARAYAARAHVVLGAEAARGGARLSVLAHELAHVVQQSDTAQTGVIRRDFATEPPANAQPQPDLTDEQIDQAIAFNRSRYDEANTRLIQGLVGGPVTGVWDRGNIIAIASSQEEYGLTKDGKVGHDTFVFLNNEQRLEGAPTNAADCLVAFNVSVRGPNFSRVDASHCQFDNLQTMQAEFSSRCNCATYEYRQFIRGHLLRNRGGVITDIGSVFLNEPGGALPAAFTEDADLSDPTPHFGHRADPAGRVVEDHYLNDAHGEAQATGCRYRGNDFPSATINDCQAGDTYDVEMNFRGEVQRGGVPVETKFWTAFHRPAWAP